VAGQGLCLTGAHYSTLLKWHVGVPLLPADCADRPCPLCGEPVDIFRDHAVSCKKSGFGERNGTQSFFCQVLTQARITHDREVDVAGNGRRPANVLGGVLVRYEGPAGRRTAPMPHGGVSLGLAGAQAVLRFQRVSGGAGGNGRAGSRGPARALGSVLSYAKNGQEGIRYDGGIR